MPQLLPYRKARFLACRLDFQETRPPRKRAELSLNIQLLSTFLGGNRR